MEFMVVLILGGGMLFLLIGSIKGFIAHGQSNELRRELILLHRRLTRLESTVKESEPSEAAEAPSEFIAAQTPVEEAPETPVAQEPPVEESVLSTPGIHAEPPVPPDVFDTGKEWGEPVSIQRAQDEAVLEKTVSASPPKKPSWFTKFEGMDWETLIGTYIVPRLGALGITIAVFIGLALAAQKYGPGFRIVLGYGVSVGLLAGGRATENKYPSYARVLYGAGLAVAYFVSFASHYIPFARIFESPLPSLAGMAAIVGIWAIIAEKRNSPTIAMLVTALGHFTIGLTSLTVDNPGVYSVFGIVLLSIGSAFFLLKNRWYYVAAAGMIASYANHFLLMASSESAGTQIEFIVGISVLSTYLLIFALSELFAPEKLRRESVPSAVRSLFVATNTALFFVLGSLLVDGYDFTEDYHHVFQYSLAATLLGIALLYYFRRKEDPMYNTYIAKAVTMATLGLAVQFDGHTLTVGLSIEMLALFASSYRSGLVVTRALAHVVGIIAFLHGMATFLFVMRFMPYDHADYTRTLIQSILPPVAFLLAAYTYQRVDWTRKMRVGVHVPRSLRTLLWQLDLYDTPDDRASDLKKPFDGLLLPGLMASAGAVLWLSDTLRLIHMDDRFNLYALTALGLLALGWFLRCKPFALTSTYFFTATLVMTWQTMVDKEFSAWYVVGVIAVLLVALSTEPRLLPDRGTLSIYRGRQAPYFFYAVAWWCIGLYLTHLSSDMNLFIALLVASSIAAGSSIVLHARALSFAALGYLIWAQLGWQLEVTNLFESDSVSPIETITALLMIITAIGLDRFFTYQSRPQLGSIALIPVFMTAVRLAFIHAAPEWLGTVIALDAAALLVYATLLRTKMAALLSTLATLLAMFVHLVWAYETHDEFLLMPTVAGFLSVIALFIVYERGINRIAERVPAPILNGAPTLAIVAATLLSVLMLERIPQLANLYLTLSWSLLALAYFVFAVFSQQKMYRYAGLAILTLAILRVVFIDTTDLEPVARIFAFGGLGVVLLATGFGYAKAFGKRNMTSE